MTPQKSSSESLLPDPDLLRYYDETVGPGTSKKIVEEFLATLALDRTKAQMNFELQVREQRIQICGQIFAFTVAMTAIAGGLWLAFIGTPEKTVTGGLITGGTVLGITVAFLKGRRPPDLK
jgi:uncharacterized membrane protein